MNDEQADALLRSLFREVGGHTAPPGLEGRILQRTALVPAFQAVGAKPLLPRWAWVLAGLILAALLLLGLNTTTPAGTGLVRSLPEGLLDAVLASHWLTMALSATALFMALSSWLQARLYAGSAN